MADSRGAQPCKALTDLTHHFQRSTELASLLEKESLEKTALFDPFFSVTLYVSVTPSPAAQDEAAKVWMQNNII